MTMDVKRVWVTGTFDIWNSSRAGEVVILVVFAAMCSVAGLMARGLDEVQR